MYDAAGVIKREVVYLKVDNEFSLFKSALYIRLGWKKMVFPTVLIYTLSLCRLHKFFSVVFMRGLLGERDLFDSSLRMWNELFISSSSFMGYHTFIWILLRRFSLLLCTYCKSSYVAFKRPRVVRSALILGLSTGNGDGIPVACECDTVKIDGRTFLIIKMK